MDFNEYQKKARTTAIYKNPIVYPTLGLTGEAGEVADKVKKVLRDNDGQFTTTLSQQIAAEIGDVLWYCANLAQDLGFDLNGIAESNIRKLEHRKKMNKIHGSGDNR